MAIINGYSNYTAAGLQNHGMAVTDTAYQPPVANDVVVGLCLQTNPFQTGYVPGTVTSEPIGIGGYTRAVAKSGDPSGTGVWTVSAQTDVTEIENQASITFNVSTASWGTVYYFGVFDNADPNVGQLIWGAAVTTPKLIENETVVVFTPQALKIKARNV